MSQIEKNAKKNRSTVPVIAALIGCVLSAYGFSRQSTLFLWILPLGLVSAATLWAIWPRASERRKASGNA